jgi:Prp8 binding protein
LQGGIDNTIYSYDIRNTELPLMTLHSHQDTVTSLSTSPSGSFLLSNGMDSQVCIHDIRPFCQNPTRLVRTFQGAPHGYEKNLIRAAWDQQNEEFILAGAADRTVVVWEVKSGRIVYKLPGHKGCVNDVDWHPREPVIVSASTDGMLYLGELNPEQVRSK